MQRIAYVDVNEDHNSALMKFAETVAVNRGINIRLFENVHDAERWLIAEVNQT